MRIRVDASAIVPGHSAGIETFTFGLLNGLADIAVGELEVTIVAGTGAQWRQQVPYSGVRWSEVAQPLRSDRRLGAGLRRVIPAPARSSRLARGVLTALRSRANPVSPDDPTVTLYPFHRVPARSRRSVVTVHDLRTLQPEFHSAADAEVIRANVERAAALVVSWPHPYRQLLSAFPEAREKTALIPLPVFHGRPARVPVAPEPEFLLFPSSTAPHKNHLTLLEALVSLPEYRLACPGPLVDPEASRCAARVAETGMRDRVSFPGFVPAPQLHQLYARAGTVVVPSRWEAASGAIFEAFAWGVPVACADVAPLRAQVEYAGADVAFFDPDDPASIAEAVRRVRADRERYAAASRRAGQRLAERDWARTAREYAAVLAWVRDGCPGAIPNPAFPDPAFPDPAGPAGEADAGQHGPEQAATGGSGPMPPQPSDATDHHPATPGLTNRSWS